MKAYEQGRSPLVWLSVVILMAGCARRTASTTFLKTTEGRVAFTNELNNVGIDVAQGNSAKVTLTEKRDLDVGVPADNASPLRMRVRDRFASASAGSNFTATANARKETTVVVAQGTLVLRGRSGCEKVAAGSERVVETAALQGVPIDDIQIPTIHYGFKSAKPLAADAPVIDCVADLLADYPDARLALEGHSDDVGSIGYNIKLSRRRAEGVRRALVASGIQATRIEVKAFGRSRPRVPSKTAAARAENRRVELKVAGGH